MMSIRKFNERANESGLSPLLSGEIALIYSGSQPGPNDNFVAASFYFKETGAAVWHLPLPHMLGDKKLYINSLRFDINESNLSNKITSVKILGMSATNYDGLALLSDISDKTAAQEYTYDVDDFEDAGEEIDCSLYDCMVVKLNATVGLQLKVTYVVLGVEYR
jgi:hypothetical protein